MRTALCVLASLVVCTTNLFAEGPVLAKINRFFGLGWGDGYHVGWNDCNGSQGSVGCPSVHENIREPAAPSIPVLAPASTGLNFPGQSSGSRRSQIVNIFPTPQQLFAATPAPKAAAPRVIRLPPVIEPTQIAKRLPPVTQTAQTLENPKSAD